LSIEQHCAGAADAFAATVLGARKSYVEANEAQEIARRILRFAESAVDLYCDHLNLPSGWNGIVALDDAKVKEGPMAG
jgi:hypothetical protein